MLLISQTILSRSSTWRGASFTKQTRRLVLVFFSAIPTTKASKARSRSWPDMIVTYVAVLQHSWTRSILASRQDAFGIFLFRQNGTVFSCCAEHRYDDMSNFDMMTCQNVAHITCFLTQNDYGYWISILMNPPSQNRSSESYFTRAAASAVRPVQYIYFIMIVHCHL